MFKHSEKNVLTLRKKCLNIGEKCLIIKKKMFKHHDAELSRRGHWRFVAKFVFVYFSTRLSYYTYSEIS